jgi:hypothetical protein
MSNKCIAVVLQAERHQHCVVARIDEAPLTPLDLVVSAQLVLVDVRCVTQVADVLPELKEGEDLRQFRWMSDVEKDLLGFCLNFQQVSPRAVCTEWASRKGTCRLLKRRLLDNYKYVRNWKITCLHYADLPDVEATWFIDPPYQHGRSRYRYHCVADYRRLARWCRSRRGQVIVCEGYGATWLPFTHFTRQQVGTADYFEEVIWTKTT